MKGSTMTIAPRTPFLPTSRHFKADQSLLIEAELTFDDSFEAWPASPRAYAPTGENQCDLKVRDTGSVLKGDEIIEGEDTARSIEGDLMDEVDGKEARSSRKRASVESPGPDRAYKKIKVPTPIRNDFYTRRVKDADRRSSLGLMADRAVFDTLHRSVSRDSIRSSTSSSSFGLPHPHITPIPPSSDAESSFRRSPSQSRSRDTFTVPHQSPDLPSFSHLSEAAVNLKRTDSSLSTSTSDTRHSLSGRVTGFLSKLIRRSSSIMSGIASEVDQAAVESPIDSAREQETSRLEGVELGKWPYPDPASSERAPKTGLEGSGGLGQSGVQLETSSLRPHGGDSVSSTVNCPRLRLPPPLTRYASHTLATSTRALLPKKTAPSSQPPRTNLHPLSKAGESSKAPFRLPSTSRQDPIPPQPRSGSSFTSRALSRLPGPGKGSSSSSKPIVIRATERASDLSSKRETFERLAREAAEERERSLAKYSAALPKRQEVKRTIPIKGNTPGKASRQRAEERARFEQGLRERHEEKRKKDEEVQRAREEMERAEDDLGRAERIVWAKGLPAMYAKGGG